ncbi:surface antigen [Plasmodium falciparum UGT5.1]|uniref:Surface antigen n=1 Tax=Plasmodium falciparum UGT5.1 TaxID=1237627 RepID=W7JVI0_PLAFA|nr:surface antigen [Plasmodium falciparum UGT5.1]
MILQYSKILLFSLLLNILVSSSYEHNKNKTYITPHTTTTSRVLSGCEIQKSIYDDPDMKYVKENFDRQTSQRFEEYNERMNKKRQTCKEQCDKEIQKIILKDKLEKQMKQELTTLETKITTDDIPTCICEKSVADKVEKGCLRCAGVLGGGIAPTFGLIGSVAINMWKTTEIAAATKAAIAKGTAAGKIAGDIEGAAKVIDLIESTFYINELGGTKLQTLFTAKTYTNVTLISESIHSEFSRLGCGKIIFSPGTKKPICNFVYDGMVAASPGEGVSPKNFIKTTVENMVSEAESVAAAKSAKVAAAEKAAILETSTKAIETTSYNWYTTIGYSITAILIIVLIMVIIYLILRYRRKKKMKKKLQYIKLLKE